jgi:hypothetical protein
MDLNEVNAQIEVLRSRLLNELAKRSCMVFADVFRKSTDNMKKSDKPLPIKIAHQKAINDLFMVVSLLIKIKDHGLPNELVFIDNEGTSHDLINHKELDENELINIILDNAKRS